MTDDGSDALATGAAPGAGRLRSALGRWGPPLGLAVLIVATAPFVAVLREAVQGRFGLGYLRWVTGALALVAAAALAWAVVRIRERRALRYGALVLAAALVALQVAFWTTGAAEVDMVERVHLAEYGLLAILFARALRPRHDDRLLPVLALLALALASLADEGVQWLTPVRVGDGRDVLLNLWAGVVGLLFGLALAPPRGLLRPAGERSRRLAAGLGAAAVLAGALFFDLAHLGHEVHDPRAGVFLSWHSPEALARSADERARRWAAGGVPRDRPLAREDQFRTEAGWHVIARNDALTAGDLDTAWHENRILERWYGPFVGRPGYRWPRVQRDHIRDELRARDPAALAPSPRYRSPALAGRVVAGPPRALWWAGALAAAGWLGWLAARPRDMLGRGDDAR
jgi:hypothetical protein